MFTGIPDKIEVTDFESLKFTDAEKEHIIDTYIMPLYDNISENKFTSIENADGSTTYTLTISYLEMRNMLVNMLQTLSTDMMMMNKINSILTEITQTSELAISTGLIQDLISEINSGNVPSGNVAISVTNQEGTVNKLDITFEDVLIEMTKTQTDSSENYKIALSEATNSDETENVEISLEMAYTGLNTNTVSESMIINIGLTEEMSLQYNYTNNVTFGNVNIQPLDTNSIILINNYPVEQLVPVLEQIGTNVVRVNEEQMTQIGYPIEFVNPLIMWFAGPTLSNYFWYSAYDVIGNSNLVDEEVAVNNQIFINYQGEISGASAKVLCDTVRSHNLTNSADEQVNIKLGEPASATAFLTAVNDPNEIKLDIKSGSTYNVTLSYDTTTGYVCEIGVVETSGQTSIISGNTIDPNAYSPYTSSENTQGLISDLISEAEDFTNNY